MEKRRILTLFLRSMHPRKALLAFRPFSTDHTPDPYSLPNTMDPELLPTDRIEHSFETDSSQPVRNRWSYEHQLSDRFVDFRFLESWDSIENIVDDLGHEFNEFHATAVFARIRYIPQPEDLTFHRKLIDKTKLMIDGMSAKHLLLILCSSLRLDIPCPEFQQMMVHRLMQMESPLPVESSLLGSVMLALGLLKRQRLHSKQDPVIFPMESEFAKHLLNRIENEHRIQDFTEMECVKVLYMLAHLQSVLDPDWNLIESICRKLAQPGLIHRLTELSGHALISSLALLGHRDERLLDLVIDQIMKSESLFFYRDIELSYLAYSLGTLQYWNGKLFESIFKEALTEERRSRLTELNLINLVHGLSKQKQELTKFEKRKFLYPLLMEAGQDHRLENYLTIGLTGLLYHLGVIGYPKIKDLHLITPIVKELTSKERLPTATSQGLATAFWGLGKMEFKDWKLIDVLAGEMMNRQRLESFADQGLSIIIYTCGQLEYQNSKLINTLLSELTKEGRIEKLINQDLCNVAFGLGRTSCADSKFVHRIMTECLKKDKLHSFKNHQICNVLRMSSKLQACNEDDLELLLEELIKPDRFNELLPVELQEALLAICSTRSLIKSPKTLKIIKRALEKVVLESFETSQLSALGVAISLSRGVHSLENDEKEHFVQEVGSEWRIQQFNPIDLTNLYTTLISIGVQERTPLVQLMDAIDRKPFDQRRKASQFKAVLAATVQIKDPGLKSELLEIFLTHLTSSESLKVFDAFEAFGVLSLLVKFQINSKLKSQWTKALDTFTVLAQTGDLSKTSDYHFLIFLEDAVALGNQIPAEIPIGDLLLSMFTPQKTSRMNSKTLIRCIGRVAMMSLSTSKEGRSGVLKLLLEVLRKKERLCSVDDRTALHLLEVLEGYDVLSEEMREELVRASYGSTRSNRNQTVAFALEQMTGCLEN